jgi:Transposase zinc-binding domain
MDASCPVAQSRREAAQERFTLGDILRAFLPIVLPLLKLGQHHLRVLGQLAACGTLQLGANLFPCPHCGHRHWAPRCCGSPALPRLPSGQKPAVVGQAAPEPLAGALLPLRLHVAPGP